MKTNTMKTAMLIVAIFAILLSSFASAEDYQWVSFQYTWNAPLTTTGDLIGINYTIKNGSLHRNQVSGAREPIVAHEVDAVFSNKLYSSKLINFDFETGNGISEVKVTAYVRADYLQDIEPEDYTTFMDEMVAKTVESKKSGSISRVFSKKVTEHSERFAYMVTEKGNHEISVWQFSDEENGYTLKGQQTAKAIRATSGKTSVNKTETKPVETVVEEQPVQEQPEQEPEQEQPEQETPEQDQPEQEQPEQEPAPVEDDIILVPREEPEQEQPKQEEPEQEPEQEEPVVVEETHEEEPQNEPNQDEDAIVLVPRVDNADVTDQATGGKVVNNPFN
jgi:hypothetical protein